MVHFEDYKDGLKIKVWKDRWGHTHAELVEDKEFEESLSVYEAADIWASNGKDQDYMFGYSFEELEEALNK